MSVANHLNSEAEASGGSFGMAGVVDEERDVGDPLSFVEFARERHDELGRQCLKPLLFGISSVSGSATAYRQHRSSSTRVAFSSSAFRPGLPSLVGRR